MARIHNLEDDITFERVRHMPKRTRVCSIHRQLSWACNKEVQIYEKGAKVTVSGLERSKSAMQDRFRELRTIQRKLMFNNISVSNRRASCPAVLNSVNKRVSKPISLKTVDESDSGHHVSDKDIVTGKSLKLERKQLPRSISVNVKLDSLSGGKGVSKDKDSSNDDEVESPRIPASVLQRRKTMPVL